MLIAIMNKTSNIFLIIYHFNIFFETQILLLCKISKYIPAESDERSSSTTSLLTYILFNIIPLEETIFNSHPPVGIPSIFIRDSIGFGPIVIGDLSSSSIPKPSHPAKQYSTLMGGAVT